MSLHHAGTLGCPNVEPADAGPSSRSPPPPRGGLMEEGASEAGHRSSCCFISGSWERKLEMMNRHLSPGGTAGRKGDGTGREGRLWPGIPRYRARSQNLQDI